MKKTQKGKGKKVGEVRYVRRKVNPVHGREVVVMENGGIAGVHRLRLETITLSSGRNICIYCSSGVLVIVIN